VQLDQRDPKAIDAAARKVVDEFGRVDILVNNAAWNIGIPFKELDPLTAKSGTASWKRICAVHSCSPGLWRRTCARTAQEES
jgi:3-oxoacyl-[acyl-carrier protein] reductase